MLTLLAVAASAGFLETESWSTGVAIGGGRAVVGFDDGTVIAYSLPDQRELWRWSEPEGKVRDVDLLLDGSLAVGGDQYVYLLDPDGKLVRRFGKPFESGSGVLSLAVSPDGRFVAAGSFDGTTQVYDVHEEKPVAVLHFHKGWIEGVAFDPTSTRLATAADDGTVRVWSLSNFGPLMTMTTPVAPASVAFSADGKSLYVGGDALMSDRLGTVAIVDEHDLVQAPAGASTLIAVDLVGQKIAWEAQPGDQVVGIVARDGAIYAGVFENGTGHRVCVIDPQQGRTQGLIEVGYGSLLDFEVGGADLLAGRTHGTTLTSAAVAAP